MGASTVGTRALALGAMIACVGVFAFAAPASASPFTVDLDNGRLNLGSVNDAGILPAPAMLGPAVLPDLWVARNQTIPSQGACLNNIGGPGPGGSCGPNPAAATVSGELFGNLIGIPASGFQFPIMAVPNPLGGSPLPITLAATGYVTGQTDTSSDPSRLKFNLTGAIEARYLTGLIQNPLGSYCAVPLTGLTLSTASNPEFTGVPYPTQNPMGNGTLTGNGALTGTFSVTSDATSVGGADCATVNSVSKGAGSIWVSSGMTWPLPDCPAGQSGTPPDCVPDKCPTGFTGNKPNCVKLTGKINILTPYTPKFGKLGKWARYHQIGIQNVGNVPIRGVQLKVSGVGLTPAKRNFGDIPQKRIWRTNVLVKLKKKGKLTVKFAVTAKNVNAPGTVSRTVTRTIFVK